MKYENESWQTWRGVKTGGPVEKQLRKINIMYTGTERLRDQPGSNRKARRKGGSF